MRGQIITVDGASGDGLISGDDGLRYTFAAGASRSSVRIGDKVDFIGTDGVASDIMILGGGRPYGAMPASARPAGGIDWSALFWSMDGRIRRSHFWAAWGILFAANLLLGWIPLIGFLVSLALIWPSIAIQTKRLHDMGKTGWFQLLPYAAWIVAIIVAVSAIGFSAVSNPEGFENGDPSAVFSALGPLAIAFVLVLLGSIGYLIWIGATEGQPGRNRFGPNPKYPVQDQADVFT
jgi:uncharacterized membrane protein YhaH (DUF805 family)